MSKEKICIACGMPLRAADDYPQGDTGKDYCKHCARADGSMQSYAEKKAGTTAFLIKTQGLTEQAAEQAAVEIMKTLPAWQGC